MTREKLKRLTSGDEQQFNYEPLSDNSSTIRVLQVNKGEDGSIRCLLKNIALDADAEYICLSYMWGEAMANQTIYVNEQSLQVRPNLFGFLCQACKLRMRQWLWIDAICINQNDLSERNAQVRIMSNVYRLAQFVVIYPGIISNPSTAQAMIAIWRVYAYIKPKIKPKGLVLPNAGRGPFYLRYISRARDVYYQVIEDHITELFTLPYWDRMWIVQEIALARNVEVLCNDKLIPWPFLRTLPLPKDSKLWLCWRYLHHLLEEESPGSSTMSQLEMSSTANIYNLLRMFSDRQCKIINDRVYGILSLVHVPRAFPVDYSRNAGMVVLDVLEHFPLLYAGHSNVRNLKIKVIGVAWALRSFPNLLCYSCFKSTGLAACHNFEPATDKIAASRPYHCFCREYPLRLVWITQHPVDDTWKQRRNALYMKNSSDEDYGRPGRCDGCGEENLGCTMDASFNMKRLNDDLLLVTVEHPQPSKLGP